MTSFSKCPGTIISSLLMRLLCFNNTLPCCPYDHLTNYFDPTCNLYLRLLLLQTWLLSAPLITQQTKAIFIIYMLSKVLYLSCQGFGCFLALRNSDLVCQWQRGLTQLVCQYLDPCLAAREGEGGRQPSTLSEVRINRGLVRVHRHSSKCTINILMHPRCMKASYRDIPSMHHP